MIINGKKIAQETLDELARERSRFGALTLGIVMGTGDAATDSFVKIKTRAAERLGVELVKETLPNDAETDDAVAAVGRLAKRAYGIIVQLPLPAGVDSDAVLRAIPKELDVDGINPDIPESARLVHAPVAEAVKELLERQGLDARGKRAVVVGNGRLVGKPSAHLLAELGARVEVLSFGDSLAPLADADIIVLGAGSPSLVKPEHLKEEVVLIDAGTSEAGGKLAGDADPACAQKASVFTPVPGGVGPIAVAMIFKNLFELKQRASGE